MSVTLVATAVAGAGHGLARRCQAAALDATAAPAGKRGGSARPLTALQRGLTTSPYRSGLLSLKMVI